MKRAACLVFVGLGVVACHAEPPRIIAESMTSHLEKSEPEETIRAKRAGSISIEEWKKKNECELGEIRACQYQMPEPPSRVTPVSSLHMRCIPWADGTQHFDRSTCYTPLVVAWDDAKVRFTTPKTTAFTIGGARTEWVSAGTPWLALDRDGSGCIEGEDELFAGFAPLALYDENHDGKIDDTDPVYARLVLWSDRDQDKACTASELTSLATSGIEAIDLAAVDHPQEFFGSYEGETASVVSSKKARVVDVHLEPL